MFRDDPIITAAMIRLRPGLGISRSSQRCRPAPWANSPNNTSPDYAVMDSSVAASWKGSTVRAIFCIGPPVNLPVGESFRRDHYTETLTDRGLQLFSSPSNRGNRDKIHCFHTIMTDVFRFPHSPHFPWLSQGDEVCGQGVRQRLSTDG